MNFCILYMQLFMPVCTEWLVAVQESGMIKRDENTRFWKRAPLKQLYETLQISVLQELEHVLICK